MSWAIAGCHLCSWTYRSERPSEALEKRHEHIEVHHPELVDTWYYREWGYGAVDAVQQWAASNQDTKP